MNKEEFIQELNKININVSEEQMNNLETFSSLLKEYNKKFNLTSITNNNDIYLKHFYDSIFLMSIEEFKNKSTLLDIGSGAGFPGIPLAIFNKNMKFYLVESNRKKCNFMQMIKEKLNLENVEIINKRAEDYARENREKFDLATSRAVTQLKILLELEIPALKINGLFIPLKGEYELELKDSEKTLKSLSSQVKKIYQYNLPKENSKRSIIVIEKLQKTNEIYPREYSKIIKDSKNTNN